MSGADQATIEDRIQEEINRLDEIEVPSAEDIERFRQSLPLDPDIARAVQRALPFPYGMVFEFVEGSEHQSAYWRTTPDRGGTYSPAEREIRERFARAAEETEGVGGVVKYGDEEIPRSAASVAERVAGESEGEKKPPTAASRGVAKLEAFLAAARQLADES